MSDPHPAAGVAGLLEPSGLEARGWLKPEIMEAPVLECGEPSALICLVGHGGGAFWPIFALWRELHPDVADPLDTWSRQVIRPIAARLSGEVVFPSDKPWQPFQKWAMAAEGLRPSPLGLLIHPKYGLWHGYRGAILFGARAAEALDCMDNVTGSNGSFAQARHPCDSCEARPCLKACPVAAFTADGFSAGDCRAYLETPAGTGGCMDRGCLARDACPVGRAYRYGDAQTRFHMAAFSQG
ncbi:MAG: ferredoxin [Hoeflea sp.]|uniref:ferredoxin n=1 Tax=Hoeflea sp. TaxID=1940281 RepID=UPI0032EC5627